VQEVRGVPREPKVATVAGMLRCVAEGRHPMPMQKGHPGSREGVVHGEGRVCRQLLQEALYTRLQVRE